MAGILGFDNIGKALGSDAFSNLLGLGSNMWQMNSMNKQLGFNKDMANKQMAMQQGAYNANMEDRQKAQNLNWDGGYNDSAMWAK